MKKSNFLIVILLFFSLIVDASLALMPAHAEKEEIKLVDENFLKLSYMCEEEKDAVQWQVKYKCQSEEGEQQRLKFRLTDEKDKAIDYPKLDNLIERDGWLIERSFSKKTEGQLTFKRNHSTKKLRLYVQVDQQKKADKNNKDIEIKKDILERTEPFILEYGKTQKKTATTDSSERKKETRMSSVSSEEFIGPKINEKKSRNFLMSPASNGSSLMYRSSYQNKEPSYKEDAGKYPEFSWQPAGQTNVINHQACK